MMTKRLIVNADDLGRTAGINQELEVLTDPRVREAVDRAGVRLVGFGQL
jgi:predicted glycoside hydrolase/deacetylase ChbG (UPF0249 family)